MLTFLKCLSFYKTLGYVPDNRSTFKIRENISCQEVKPRRPERKVYVTTAHLTLNELKAQQKVKF